MQYDKYIPGLTEHHRAITIKQPLADALAFGKTTEVIRKQPTDYRGEVLIVAAPAKRGERNGMMVARGILEDVKGVRGGYLYTFRDVSRVIEYPCQKCEMEGEVWDCYYTKGCVTEYPKINLRHIFGLRPLK